MGNQQSRRLIQRVEWRARLTHLGRSAFVALLAAAGVYALLRLLAMVSLIPVLPAWSLAVVPVVALLVALLWHRRPGMSEAAHLVDQRMSTKDLFLTVALLENAPGDYKPIVLRDAEEKAPTIQPQTVVPFNPWPKTGGAVLAMSALAALFLLPNFDPFGFQAERRQEEQTLKEVIERNELIAMRKEELKKKELDRDLSRPVGAALDETKFTFDRLAPNQPAQNQQRLENMRDRLNQLWEKNKEEQLKTSPSGKGAVLRGTRGDLQKAAAWKEELNEGKSDKLQGELQEIKDLADKFLNAADETERQEVAREIDDRLKGVADFVQQQIGSDNLRDALNDVIKQLDAAEGGSEKVAQEAMEGLKDSLDLSEMEVEKIAQMLKDQKALEKAMEAVQKAQRLNELQQGVDCEQVQQQMQQGGGQPGGQPGGQGGAAGGAMQPGQGNMGAVSQGAGAGEAGEKSQGGAGESGAEGGSMSQAEAMAEYIRVYEQMISQCEGGGGGDGGGAGAGMGGPGQGQGGIAPENPDLTTDFMRERPNIEINPDGEQILWQKQLGEADAGTIVRNYRAPSGNVRNAASEAVNTEEIPPGYLQSIRDYFDRFEKAKDDAK